MALLVMMMKATGAIVLLMVLASCASAYSLEVKVTGYQDTLLVNTNVSLLTGGVVLADQKTDSKTAIARFNVSQGSYFVLLRRGLGYPLHVNLVRVEGDTSVTYTMSQSISYASAYGQIYGPSDFSNTTITAYSGGAIVKKTAANRDGFYILSFVPEGNYELQFSSPGFEPQSLEAFLPLSDSVQVNAQLSKPSVPTEQPPAISAPATAQQFSLIEVALSRGGSPLAGENISVLTPSGRLVLATGQDGKVRINAAESGTYLFSYGSLSGSTYVAAKEAAQPPKPAQNETPAPAQPGQQEQPTAPSFSMLAVALFILAGLLFVGAAVLAAWWFLDWRGKKKQEERGQEKHKHHQKK